MHTNTTKNRRPPFLALAVAAVLLVYPVQAATSDSGDVSTSVEQLVEVQATDAAIALGPATPTSGAGIAKFSTVDSLVFSNGKSNVQAAWDLALSAALTKDADGVTITDGAVSYQGTSSQVQDLVYLGQSSAGKFMPWNLATGADLSIETGADGWISHADCGASVYKGSLSVVHFDNAGAKQAAQTLYYEVCDASTEIYLGAAKDLSAGDKAIIVSQASSGSQATAANYELSVLGTDYVFYSAAGADSVTLRRGHHVDLGSTANSESVYALIELPDGFPAGSFSVSVTASASDINSS